MYPCELQEQAPRHTVSIRFRSPVQDLPTHFGRVWGSLIAYLGTLGEYPAGAPYATYHNMDMQDLDIEAGFPVARPLPGKSEIQATEIPGGMFAVCHYTGPYNQIGPAYGELTQFVQQQGCVPSGAAYEWYLNDPTAVPPQELKTDIAFPVMRIG